MSKTKKSACNLIKFLKDTKINIITGTLLLFTQSIIILNSIPSLDMAPQSVLEANTQALIDIAVN